MIVHFSRCALRPVCEWEPPSSWPKRSCTRASALDGVPFAFRKVCCAPRRAEVSRSSVREWSTYCHAYPTDAQDSTLV